jgi:hypothetical protein
MRKTIEELYHIIDKTWTDERILKYLNDILPLVPEEDEEENIKFITYLENRIEKKVITKRNKRITQLLNNKKQKIKKIYLEYDKDRN